MNEGIPTKEIYKLIETLSTGRTRVLKRDLRSALGEMKSKPDFEVFIQQLLGKMGYDVRDERIIPGRCVNWPKADPAASETTTRTNSANWFLVF